MSNHRPATAPTDAAPGQLRRSLPRAAARRRQQSVARDLEATRRRGGGERAQRGTRVRAQGCFRTDPEPGMDSGRATVRNMRSKCRCSCVLQFTFRHAVNCVLHRPPSQVIHCTVLCDDCGFNNKGSGRRDKCDNHRRRCMIHYYYSDG